MKSQNVVFIFSVVFLLGIFILKKNEKNHVSKADHSLAIDSIAIRYSTNCASCHGEKLNGFVDRKWKYGSSKEEIMASITKGYAEGGMPTFGALFSEEQIAELADFVLNGVEAAKKYDFDTVISPVFETELMTVKLDTIFSGTNNPWGMVFLPDGEMLITDRGGKLYHLNVAGDTTVIEGTPEVLARGQGGLLDIELHPDYNSNRQLYLSFSKPVYQDNDTLVTTAVVRGTLSGYSLIDILPVFEAFPPLPTKHHYGSRLEFGNDGYLYISVGDRGRRDENPQDLTKDPGKVHRIKDDGTVPQDNPFVLNPEARQTIFSYGHRNPQGMAKDPITGKIWATEHGPRGGDELNHILPGLNYGWPVISYGINYDGTVFTTETSKEGMEQPITYWVPSIAPSGLVFVSGDKYPMWKGNLLAGSMRFRYLNRIEMTDSVVSKEEAILKNIGRVRNVAMGPDGYIYVSVEEPGYVFRLLPVERQ